MQVRLLGPFQLEEGGRQIRLGGKRQKAVLAQLVLHANAVVPSEQILIQLWGEDTPPSAANSLQAAISRLRRVLPPGRLVTRGPGYLLHLMPQESDLQEFGHLFAEGRGALAAGDPDTAARTLRVALALWHGPALADFRYEPFAQAEIARLEDLRLECLEERMEADLATGQGGHLVPQLHELVAEHPLRERLRGQLIRALYRSGRQSDALDAFHGARKILRDELGLEPSPELVRLHRAVLAHDKDVLARPNAPPPVAPLRRRLVTVLSLQLHYQALDPEAVDLLHERTQSVFAPIVQRYGGTVFSPDRDRLIGLFGASSLHEDDALRAVRAGVEARDELGRDPGPRPAAAVGIATAEGLVGGDRSPAVSGDVMSRAAALAEAASVDDILIDLQTLRLCSSVVDVQQVGGDRYRLVSAHPGAPAGVSPDGPMIGRDAELRALHAVVRQATTWRRAFLALVTGEAGLGKSRLVTELTAGLTADARFLVGRCLPYGDGITFWPLREMVRHALGGAESLGRLVDLLRPDPDAEIVAYRLMTALGTADRGAVDNAEIFWAARRLFEALASHGPLVVVFEDLHWAEPMLLDLVESVALQAGAAPLVLVGITRPELLEDRPDWAAGVTDKVHVELSPLAPPAARRLLVTLAAGEPITSATATHILETGGGNPLFLEQLVLSLREGEWVSGQSPTLPATIQALLAARLERLGPAERDVLLSAAVEGKDFTQALVERVLGHPLGQQVRRHLLALIRKGLVQPRTGGGPEDHSFRHVLIQQVAYRSIPKMQRARLHEQLADLFELLPDEGPYGLHEIVGYHLEQSALYHDQLAPSTAGPSTQARRGARHLETAGESASARGDAVAAGSLLRRAAALMERDPPSHARILTGLAEALTETGEFESARQSLLTAQRIAADRGDAGGMAHTQVLRLGLDMQVHPESASIAVASHAPELRQIFEQSADPLGLCRVEMLQAAVDWNLARSELAERAWNTALGHAREAGASREEVRCLTWLASAATWGPTPVDQAIDRCESYLEQIGGQPSCTVFISLLLAMLHAMRGGFRNARSLLTRSLSVLDEFGGTLTAVITAQPIAFVAMLEGDPIAAEHHLRSEYESLSRLGHQSQLATAAALLAQAIVAQNSDRHDEIDALLEVSRQAGGGEDVSAEIIADGAQARSLASRGRQREAEAMAAAAVGRAESTDLISQHGDACVDLAWVLGVGGKPSPARAALGTAHRLFERKGNRAAAHMAGKVLAHLVPIEDD